MTSPETVAIAGGGAAGTLAAIHLLATRAVPHVVLIERSSSIGQGVAYSTQDERHLLNVVAGRMSAYGDVPDHLLDWLRASGWPDTEPDTFAPRVAYGRYLRESLDEAAAGAAGIVELEVVRGEAVVARTEGEEVVVDLADGTSLSSSRLVLATGPAPVRRWPLPGDGSQAEAPWYVADPWAPGALDRVAHGDQVVLIGTGLTMVDVAISLADRAARLDAVSRHGLLPLAYADLPGPSEPQPPPKPRTSALELFREVRRRATVAERWQDVVDGVRPRSHELWQALPFEEQERFLRHARRYWEAHRHRFAPEIGDTLSRLVAAGTLNVHAGTITGVSERDGAPEVAITTRQGGAEVRLRADVVVNCTGPADAIDRAPVPIVASLLEQGLAQAGPHHLGLLVTDDGEVVGSDGAIHAMGWLRRGVLWETIAIAEIRDQAETLASAWATKPPKLRR